MKTRFIEKTLLARSAKCGSLAANLCSAIREPEADDMDSLKESFQELAIETPEQTAGSTRSAELEEIPWQSTRRNPRPSTRVGTWLALLVSLVPVLASSLLIAPASAYAQACPQGCGIGIIWLVLDQNRDGTCKEECSNQYSDCLAGTGGGYIGPVQCCVAQFEDCLCGCGPPMADPGTPGPACPGCPDSDTPTAGDPVDAATGLFLYDHTDLALRDVIPIELSRSYRELDPNSRAFGVGMTLSYDYVIVADTSGNYAFANLILPNGRKVLYTRTSSGNYYSGAQYQNTTLPGPFFGSTLTPPGDGSWLLTLRDGTKMSFASRATLTSITDRNGNLVTISRDGNNNARSIISPNGRWMFITYDSSNRVTQAQDNLGRTVSYTYNSVGRLASFTDANGGITSYGYDSAGRLVTITNPRGNVYVTNQYDGNNRVSRQTDATNAVSTFNYTLDGNGNVTALDFTDPRSYTQHMAFNSNGFLISETFAQGQPEQQTISYTRDPNTNLLTSQTDALGRTTAYSYDSRGNTLSVTKLSGTQSAVTTSYTYDPTFSQLTSVTDPLGHTWTLGLDAHGNASSVTDPLGHQSTSSYNSAGQIVSSADALGNTAHFGYTGGDLTSVGDPLGNTTFLFDDAAGRLVWAQDPLGNQTNFSYSLLDDLTRIMDADGNITALAHDADRDLTGVTDANSNATAYTYDSMDRRASRTDPLDATDTYLHDGMGNLTRHTDRRGKVTVYQYDGLNRRTFAGFGYNGSSYESTINYTWDGGNRLTAATDSVAGTIARTYDGLDRLTDEQTAQGEVSYAYDNASRRTSLTVVGQPAAVSYTWDNANRLTGITQGSAAVSFAYDNANRRTQLTLPNGIVLAYSYDNDSRPSAMTWTLAGNPAGDLEYAYDADGHVVQKTGSLAQTNLPQSATGNTFNADNEMTAFNGTALTYDANGNLVNDGTNTYAWDARNHLSATSGANTAAFVYDPFGRRASKTINGTATQFLYDGLNPVQELQSGSPSANLLTGLGIDEYFTRADSAGARDFLTDALGSTLALSDSTGTVQTAYAYEPFGNTTLSGASSTNAFQFTGRENDGTGLYFYRARYYNPAFQKFISQDPIGFAAGNANLYQYAFDAPTMANDPLGLLTFSIGFSVNLQVGPVNLSGSAGIAVDTCGGVGAYSTGGIGAGAGAEGNGGLTIGYSNAPNIGDLAGPFANSEFGAGLGPAGSLGVFTGGSPDGQVIGGNLTIGLGGGAGSSVSLTGTRVTPLNSSPCSCH